MVFLGHVRIEVDRDKPLSESVSVHLDANASNASGSIATLCLCGKNFILWPPRLDWHDANGRHAAVSLPVSECLKGK